MSTIRKVGYGMVIVFILSVVFCVHNLRREKTVETPQVEVKAEKVLADPPAPEVLQMAAVKETPPVSIVTSNEVAVEIVETNSGPKSERIVVHIKPRLTSSLVIPEQKP